MVIAPIPEIHPNRPEPISNLQVNLKVIQAHGGKFISLRWQDYLNLSDWLVDVKEHIEETNVLLCHYRDELKEPECRPTTSGKVLDSIE